MCGTRLADLHSRTERLGKICDRWRCARAGVLQALRHDDIVKAQSLSKSTPRKSQGTGSVRVSSPQQSASHRVTNARHSVEPVQIRNRCGFAAINFRDVHKSIDREPNHRAGARSVQALWAVI
jgi:hypothetical protein